MFPFPKTVLSVHKNGAISISLIGHGNLGRVLALALKKAGYQVREIVAHRESSVPAARKVASQAGAQVRLMDVAALDADVTFICVPDAAIREVSLSLAKRRNVDWHRKVVVHLSGALPADEMKALRKRGAHVGSAHPMNSFVAGTKPDFRQIPFAIEGDKRAVDVATEIARALGADAFTIRTKDKPLYHALGAFASPLLISHLQLAEQVGRKAGVKDPKKVIQQILQRTVQNYLQTNSSAAFSGPLLRGDVATIKKHLAALKAVPAARADYLTLARNAVENLPVRNARALRKLLK